MSDLLKSLVDLVSKHNGINDKSKLTAVVTKAFGLTQDRSVYYRPEFAIRFSSAQSEGFSNTVLSLSNLQKVTTTVRRLPRHPKKQPSAAGQFDVPAQDKPQLARAP